LDKNRSLYDFKSKEDFIQTPLANKKLLLENIEVYFEQQGVSINMENEALILNSIKSFMALQLFNQEAFLQIVHNQDEFIDKTKELLNKNP